MLFTPRRFSGLSGMVFPAGPTRCPDRLEMAGYLGAYADRFDLPVRTGVEVRRLTGTAGAFVAETSQGSVTAQQVGGRRPVSAGAPAALVGLLVTAGRPARRRRGCGWRQLRGDAIIGRQLHELARTGRTAVVPQRVVAAERDVLLLADGTGLHVSSVLLVHRLPPGHPVAGPARRHGP